MSCAACVGHVERAVMEKVPGVRWVKVGREERRGGREGGRTLLDEDDEGGRDGGREGGMEEPQQETSIFIVLVSPLPLGGPPHRDS